MLPRPPPPPHFDITCYAPLEAPKDSGRNLCAYNVCNHDIKCHWASLQSCVCLYMIYLCIYLSIFLVMNLSIYRFRIYPSIYLFIHPVECGRSSVTEWHCQLMKDKSSNKRVPKHRCSRSWSDMPIDPQTVLSRCCLQLLILHDEGANISYGALGFISYLLVWALRRGLFYWTAF